MNDIVRESQNTTIPSWRVQRAITIFGSVENLARATDFDLLKIQGIGRVTIAQVRDYLDAIGLPYTREGITRPWPVGVPQRFLSCGPVKCERCGRPGAKIAREVCLCNECLALIVREWKVKRASVENATAGLLFQLFGGDR